MKRILPIVFLMAFAFCVKGQGQTDQEAIIQQCIDFPELQDHFPRESNGNFIPVHIMQYPMRFEEGLNIRKFEAPPVLMSREEIYDNNVDAYFLFEKIDEMGRHALVKFSFYYDCTSKSPQYEHYDIKLEKKEHEWVITNFEIQNF